MTPKQKLEEIERGNYPWTSDVIIIPESELGWLISRIKTLEAALEKIANKSTDNIIAAIACDALDAKLSVISKSPTQPNSQGSSREEVKK